MSLCEWSAAWPSSSVQSRLVTQIESLSAAFSGAGIAKNRKEPCRESWERVEPQECSPACPARLQDGVPFGPSLAASALNFADTIRMAKSSVKMECTEPVPIPIPSASSRTVTRRSCMTKVRTWSMSS